MIIDVTGIQLVPGKLGADCPGGSGSGGECCCDECDYLMCCLPEHDMLLCASCRDERCHKAGREVDGGPMSGLSNTR